MLQNHDAMDTLLLSQPHSQALPARERKKFFHTASDGKLGGAWEQGYFSAASQNSTDRDCIVCTTPISGGNQLQNTNCPNASLVTILVHVSWLVYMVQASYTMCLFHLCNACNCLAILATQLTLGCCRNDPQQQRKWEKGSTLFTMFVSAWKRGYVSVYLQLSPQIHHR